MLKSKIKILIKEIVGNFLDEVDVIGKNIKTGYAIDFDTICPRKDFCKFNEMGETEKQEFLDNLENNVPGAKSIFLKIFEKAKKYDALKTCSYCYVEKGREIQKNSPEFKQFKREHDSTEFVGIANSLGIDPKNLRKKVDSENKKGGMRIFSSSDYKPWKYNEVKRLLDAAAKIGLKIKAVTKVLDFVKDFVDHPAINLIHLSVDTVGSGIPHNIAKSIKKKYPQKIRIRAVITNMNDLFDEIMEYVDVFTFYHGKNKIIRHDDENLNYTNFTKDD
ncbi:MAG: hypothetical protein WC466_08045, partial [Candidatus Izemoplasmatales bacterium]